MGLFSSKKQKLYEKGRDAMRRGDTMSTVENLHQAAELGHPGAGMLLGDFYRRGDWGLPKDYAKAAQYYALNPESWGRASLGMLYFYGGNGLEQDPNRALALFQEALEAKKYRFDQAEGFFGAMHFWGQGLEQDYQKAAAYLFHYDKFYRGEYPDIDYCYAYLRIHGLGGVGKSPQEGLATMEEVCRRAEQPSIRRAAAQELRNSLAEVPVKDLNQSQVHRLEQAAQAGDFQAACKAATYYLTHVRVRTRSYWDEEEKERVQLSRSESSLWPQAAAMLDLIRKSARPASLADKTELDRLLLWHGHQIGQEDPALRQALEELPHQG